MVRLESFGECICLRYTILDIFLHTIDTNSLRVAEASGKHTSQIPPQHDSPRDLEHGNLQIYRSQQMWSFWPLEFLPVSTICGVPLRASHRTISKSTNPLASHTSYQGIKDGIWWRLSTDHIISNAFYTWCRTRDSKEHIVAKDDAISHNSSHIPYKKCMKNHAATLRNTHPATDWHIQSYKPWHVGIFFCTKIAKPRGCHATKWPHFVSKWPTLVKTRTVNVSSDHSLMLVLVTELASLASVVLNFWFPSLHVSFY